MNWFIQLLIGLHYISGLNNRFWLHREIWSQIFLGFLLLKWFRVQINNISHIIIGFRYKTVHNFHLDLIFKLVRILLLGFKNKLACNSCIRFSYFLLSLFCVCIALHTISEARRLFNSQLLYGFHEVTGSQYISGVQNMDGS